jgi:hypothetical protein
MNESTEAPAGNTATDESGYQPRWPFEVKQLAYKLEPECWVSYSGKPKHFKAAMDVRRTAALQNAERELMESAGTR